MEASNKTDLSTYVATNSNLNLDWPASLTGLSTFEVGLSGGLDSVVLLDLLAAYRNKYNFTLSAVHVNHGLSANAEEWVEHCHAICAAQNVPLRVERVTVKTNKDGIESAARRARYGVYRQSQAQVLVLAHHLDDQSETLLLQTLRGGGVHALSSMPKLRALTENISLWRPLLQFSRTQLAAYAKARELTWVDDESNNDQRFLRNWLRHSITPLIAKHQPNYRQSLWRCAQQMADAAAMLDELAKLDLQLSCDGKILQLAALFKLSEPRQRQLLLRWAQSNNLGTPSPDSIEEFRQQLQLAAADRMPIWFLANGAAHRYRQTLWAEVKQDYQLNSIPIQRPENLILPAWGGKLIWQKAEYGLADSAFANDKLFLQKPICGARILTNVGQKALKNLFQEAAIPPFLRQRWPVICTLDGNIIAVPSIAVAKNITVKGGWFAKWIINN